MIDLHQTDTRWTITINRPDKANSLTGDMLAQIAQVAEDATAAQVPVLVLTGVGKVFSAGADLDEARAGLAVSDVWERVSGAIAAFPGLSICALNGTLAGGAFGMALACDLRLAVPGAKFFYPVMKLGFLPQPSDPKRMAALIGPSRAKMVLMAGQKLTTDEALSYGLIDRIVAAQELATQIDDLSAAAEAAPADIRTGIKALCS